MDAAEAAIADLEQAGVEVWLEGEELRFRAPKHVDIQAALAPIRENKEAVIHHLKEVRTPFARTPLKRQDSRPERIPLSASQGLWFRPNDPADTSKELAEFPAAWRLTGPMNVSAMREAFTGLVQRHEILRTAYHWDGVSTHQTVLDQIPHRMRVINLEISPAEERDARVQKILTAEFGREIDYSTGEAVRAWLFRISDNEHILAFVLWHIAFDNGSLPTFMGDLFALYYANRDKCDSGLPPMDLQYADYALWDAASRDDAARTNAREFWADRLSGIEPLNLVPEKSETRVSTTSGSRRMSLTRDQSKDVNRFAREHGTTSSLVMLGALNLLLHAWSGEEDLLTNYVSDGRPSGADGLAGCFVRTGPLHLSLSGDPAFLDLMPQIQAAVNDATDPRLSVNGTVKQGMGRVTINISRPGGRSTPASDAGESSRMALPTVFGGRHPTSKNRADGPALAELARQPSRQIGIKQAGRPTAAAAPPPPGPNGRPPVMPNFPEHPPAVKASNRLTSRLWRPPSPWFTHVTSDLQLYLGERPDGFVGHAVYAEGRLSGDVVEAYCESLPILMKRVLQRPDAPVSKLCAGLPLQGALEWAEEIRSAE